MGACEAAFIVLSIQFSKATGAFPATVLELLFPKFFNFSFKTYGVFWPIEVLDYRVDVIAIGHPAFVIVNHGY